MARKVKSKKKQSGGLVSRLAGIPRQDLENIGSNIAGGGQAPFRSGLEELAAGAGQDLTSRPDLAIHAEFNRRAFERLQPTFGGQTANVLRGLGFGKELLDSLRGLVGDGIGFDQTDLAANELGIQAAQDVQQKQGGGPVASPFIRIPTIQAMQQGGFVGNLINQLGNVRADTGSLDQAAQNLQSFNPFGGQAGGAAQGALSGLLQSGNPVDVNPITQAAQNQAQQTFGDLSSGINEQFGALGLGPSSARTAALGREAQRLSTNVGNTALQAGVQAQENAAGRQLGALSPFGQLSGQRLSGQQAAGNLAGQSAGLGLQAQTAPLGVSGNLASNLFQGLRQTQQPGLTGGQPATQTAPRSASRLGDGVGRLLSGPQRFQQGGVARSGQATPGRGQANERQDFGDFLGQLLFDTTFTQPESTSLGPIAQNPSQGLTISGPGTNRFGAPGSFQDFRNRLIAENQFNQQQLANTATANRQQQLQGLNDLVANATGIGGQQLQAVQGFGVRNTNPGNQLAQALNVGLGGQNPLSGGAGNNLGTFQDGGFVEGPAVPPDQVPILAQGGEGVIPVDMMSQLMQAQTPEELASIAAQIQQLMAQDVNPQMDDGQNVQQKQAGGTIFNRTQLFGQGADAIPQQQQIPTGQAATDPQGVASFFQQTGETPTELGQQGGAGGSLFASGLPQQQDLRAELQDAQRRLKLFQGLELASPPGSRVGSGEFTIREQQRIDSLQEAVIAEEQARAQQALQERIVKSQESSLRRQEMTQERVLANQQAQTRGSSDFGAKQKRVQSLVDKNRRDAELGGGVDEEALKTDLQREGLQSLVPQLFPEFGAPEQRTARGLEESLDRVEVGRLERQLGMSVQDLMAKIQTDGGIDDPSIEEAIQGLLLRAQQGDTTAGRLAQMLEEASLQAIGQ